MSVINPPTQSRWQEVLKSRAAYRVYFYSTLFTIFAMFAVFFVLRLNDAATLRRFEADLSVIKTQLNPAEEDKDLVMEKYKREDEVRNTIHSTLARFVEYRYSRIKSTALADVGRAQLYLDKAANTKLEADKAYMDDAANMYLGRGGDETVVRIIDVTTTSDVKSWLDLAKTRNAEDYFLSKVSYATEVRGKSENHVVDVSWRFLTDKEWGEKQTFYAKKHKNFTTYNPRGIIISDYSTRLDTAVH